MKLLRFATVALCLLAVAFCLNAGLRLVGLSPPSKLPPYPMWAMSHFVAGGIFAVVAPLQLWPALRGARPRLHRLCGRLGVAAGVVMAVSGLIIVHTAPDRPMSERIFMTAFFSGYSAMLLLGFRAALARDFAGHRIWMLRMTATALTPITQRLVFPVFAATLGVANRDAFWQLFVSAAWIGWALNVWAIEAWIGRGSRPAMARAAA